MTTIYRARRGATLVLPIVAGDVGADLSLITGVDAGLKRAVLTRGVAIPAVPPATTPRSATFAVQARPAANDVGPGWNLVLTHEETGELEPGMYVTDARLLLDGDHVAVSEVQFIQIEQGVSA